MKSRFFSDGVLSLAVSLINGAVGFFSVWFIASHYSLQTYGQYSLVIMTGMWLNMALFGWLRLGLLRYGMNPQDRILIVFLYAVMVFLALAVVLPILLVWNPGVNAPVTLVLAITIGLYDVVMAWTRVSLNFSSYFFVAFIRPVFFLVALILVFFLRLRFELIFAILLLSYVVPLVNWNAYAGLFERGGLSFREADWQGVFKYGITASIAGTLGYGYFALNKLIVSRFAEAKAFGAFAICADISFQIVSILFGAFHVRMFSSLLAKHGSAAQDSSHEFTRYRHVLITLFAFLLAGSIYYRAAFGVLFLKGDDGLGGYLLAVCVLLSGLYFLRVNYLEYMYHFTKRLKSIAVSALVMIALGGGGAILGFSVWGLKGMLAISVLALLLQDVVVNSYCRRFGVGIGLREVLFVAACVGSAFCLPGISSNILSPDFFALSVLFIGVLLGLLVLFNIFEGRRLVLRFFRKVAQ